MFKMWDVWDVGCSGCEMFAGMWDVDLPNAILLYHYLFFFFFLNNNRCKVSLNTCKQCITLRLSLLLTRRSRPLF